MTIHLHYNVSLDNSFYKLATNTLSDIPGSVTIVPCM